MLEQMHCQPIQTDYERIDESKLKNYSQELPAWETIEMASVPHLQKTYEFTHEHEVMMFTRELLELAEAENHHPEVICQADQVKVMWWSHEISDLHLNDLIMAAKTDQLFEKVLEFSYLQ